MKFQRLRVAKAVLAALISYAVCVPAHAEAPFSFAKTPGQLPKIAKPLHYAIQLKPNATALTFTGSEQIQVNVLTPTKTLVVNVNDIAIQDARLTGNAPQAASVKIDKAEQTATLAFPKTLAPGLHTLALRYTGKIGSQPVGLFYVKYKDGDTQKTMLSTQFEATDARRMFPCWDEPVYRATYQLTVTVPADQMAVSNMPIAKETPVGTGLKTVAFRQTPPMASYLVEFSAGDLEYVSGTADGIPVRVITTRGKKETARWALASIERILPYYDNYFGIKFPLPKMDLIAVPGGFPGAMENWGAITYNEGTILYDPKTGSQDDKEGVFHIIAHETAHQWCGDLVTMAWWNDIWLNEGFASWMDDKVTDHLNPTWQVWLRANNAKYGAMGSDARATSHPIQQTLNNPADIGQAFDEITYTKGEAVIRMIETDLGEAAFRDGIRHYIAARKYSNSTTADLWAALAKSSGQPVAKIAGTWTEQPGFPVITAQAVCDGTTQSLTLSQQRFFTDQTPSGAAMWQVPIATTGARIAGRQPYLMTTKTATLPDVGACGAPVIVNSGNVGYYRVQYEGSLWKAVQKAAPTFSPADQLALLSDRQALVTAGRVPATDYLDLAQSLRLGTNLAVWEQVIGSVDGIDHLEDGQPGQAAFRAYAIRLFRPALEKIGEEPKPGENETISSLRAELIGALGFYGDSEIIAKAHDQFTVFLKDPSSLAPNARQAVFGIVGRYADQATYDQLHQLAKASNNFSEKEGYYFSMASALDPNLAAQSLQIGLSDELPDPFGLFLIQAVGGSEHPALAWDFYKQHQKEIDAKLSGDEMFAYGFAPGIMSEFTDNARADELIAFSKAHLPAAAKMEVAKAVTRIRTSARLKAQELPSVDAWVKTNTIETTQKQAKL